MKQIATALSLMVITCLSASANTPVKTQTSSSPTAQITTKSPTKEVQRTRTVKKLHKKAASNAVAPAKAK